MCMANVHILNTYYIFIIYIYVFPQLYKSCMHEQSKLGSGFPFGKGRFSGGYNNTIKTGLYKLSAQLKNEPLSYIY